MNKTKRNGLLALLGLGAFAFWKCKKSAPKNTLDSKLDEAKDQLSRLGNEAKAKASDLADQAQEKAQELKSKVEDFTKDHLK
ncbi:YtxH domain-containing protein [Riemerella columbina]|uniref:YtxH domain-containing protein n=1 Tax=Riemerella columbina TaxID=103810 RepID=UPI00266EF972|nr:YtxH domain-containing protein [Riemerella columbina]WKS94434.1 YtxH domain-containing protein [Riemerella columbina]